MKLSQVMDAAGLGDADNASDRSEFAKKVGQRKDADGKIRYLTEPEASEWVTLLITQTLSNNTQ